jgi:tryptophan 2,3-dioxygenase
MTYWDYIQTDALLNIQNPKENFQMKWFYHVSSEWVDIQDDFEMTNFLCENIETVFFTERLFNSLFWYAHHLFSIMEDGMKWINTWSSETLWPASGFQSAQYRLIEFSSTDLINLIDNRFRDSIETLLTNMLWTFILASGR